MANNNKNNTDWIALGKKALEDDQLSNALNHFKKAISLKQNLYEALSFKGLALHKNGRNTDALEPLYQAIHEKPDDPNAWNFISIIHLEEQNFIKAQCAIQKAIDLNPTNLGYYYNKYKIISSIGELLPEKVIRQMASDAQYILDNNIVDPPEYLFEIGFILMKHRLSDISIKIFEATYENSADKEYILSNIGSCYIGKNDFEKAIEVLDRATEEDPNDKMAWYNKGVSYYNIGNIEKTISCYEKVIEINPTNTKVLFHSGLCHIEVKDYSGAIACFDKASHLDRENSTYVFYKAYSIYLLAETQYENNTIAYKSEIIAAITEIEKIRKFVSGNIGDTEETHLARYFPLFLGFLYSKINSLYKARKNLEKYLSTENPKHEDDAKELLLQVWMKSQPRFISWWLYPPENLYSKSWLIIRKGFFYLMFLLITISFILWLNNPINPLWAIIAFIMLVILYPEIESLRVKDFSINLTTNMFQESPILPFEIANPFHENIPLLEFK